MMERSRLKRNAHVNSALNLNLQSTHNRLCVISSPTWGCGIPNQNYQNSHSCAMIQ